MSDEKATAAERPALMVVSGGRRIQEEQLLREFMHPDVDNLDRVRTIAASLAPKGRLRVVGPEDTETVNKLPKNITGSEPARIDVL